MRVSVYHERKDDIDAPTLPIGPTIVERRINWILHRGIEAVRVAASWDMPIAHQSLLSVVSLLDIHTRVLSPWQPFS